MKPPPIDEADKAILKPLFDKLNSAEIPFNAREEILRAVHGFHNVKNTFYAYITIKAEARSDLYMLVIIDASPTGFGNKDSVYVIEVND